MATIHVLKTSTNLQEIPSAPEARPSAQIILFPGVRYERWVDAGEPTAADKQKRKRRSRVKRDKMTIVV